MRSNTFIFKLNLILTLCDILYRVCNLLANSAASSLYLRNVCLESSSVSIFTCFNSDWIAISFTIVCSFVNVCVSSLDSSLMKTTLSKESQDSSTLAYTVLEDFGRGTTSLGEESTRLRLFAESLLIFKRPSNSVINFILFSRCWALDVGLSLTRIEIFTLLKWKFLRTLATSSWTTVPSKDTKAM
ncbi:hypothetical protein BpHYR1_026235 [Brachionus plicatilis]|uniref:Uncharacterized protein n=1 Tax=Brachionus plicatilis TaxID=10195 RepID=A0A3M7T3Q3_BRAPC|nr:hypothetical protein BpHYR1_026235 [Brachionus plicatilis]